MEFITVKDKIFVMGHKLTDVDAFGAAMGIYRAALALEKRAYIVINEVSASLRPLYELFEQDSAYPDDLIFDIVTGDEYGRREFNGSRCRYEPSDDDRV